MMKFPLFKVILSRIGVLVPPRWIHYCNGILNYLSVGRWFRDRGFAIPVRLPDRPELYAYLAAQVTERQRAVRELERVTRERAAADKERAAVDKERAAVDKERAAVDKERAAADKERDKREEALKQQLESLRAIERGILEREEKMRGRPQ